MEKKQFKCLDKNSCGELDGCKYMSSALYEEKKSKFYSYIFEINSADEANKILYSIRKYFKDARHVVYAYVLDNEYYCSDDGEPSGTGGKAIFTLLEKQRVINTLVIVVRYFGGILLGVGPLSRAYLKAVKLAEEKLLIIPYEERVVIEIQFEYSEEPTIRNIIEKENADIINTNYGEKVIYNIKINKDKKILFAAYEKC